MTPAEACIAQGLARLGEGDAPGAIDLFEEASALSPRDPNIDFYLGESHRINRDPARAIQYFTRAASKHLRHPELSLRLGLAHGALGQHAQAAACYRSALEDMPDSVPALCNLANTSARLGELDAAISHYERAVGLEPRFAPALRNLGLMLFSARRWPQAVERLQAAAELLPDDANVAEKLAIALAESGQLDSAIARYQDILAADPGNTVALTNLGNLYYNLGRTAEALALFEVLVEQFPDSAVYRLHYGIALYSLDRYAEAKRAFDDALARSATCAMARRAGVDTVVGRVRLYEGMSALLQGDLAAGWDGYENRWFAKEPRPAELNDTPAKVWQGEDISDRRLFIFREQGIGDEIMFASMFEEAIARAGECVIQCNSRLHAAFARSFPDADVRAAAEAHDDWIALAAEMRADDVWVFTGSLPRLLRRDLAAFPPQADYLRADPDGALAWRRRLEALGPGLKVGISWAGGTLKNGARFRSLDLAALTPLLAIDGVIPVSLQYTDCRAEIAALERDTGITVTHWPEAIADYEETINLVAELDLVISVQTAIVHTAGAMNKPTWVLLPLAQTNWRWFGHREQCAWYPQARLYCQQSAGDWQGVLTRVQGELRDLVTARR